MLLLATPAWTSEGYPDCADSVGPQCFPNRRAAHHNSLLNALFNKWCSDKGTYWLSKHNYGAAYDMVLRHRRHRVANMLELGVGDETAGSLNAWREYFPKAHFHIVDVDVHRFHDTAQWSWASRQKRRHGCYDDANVWKDPRVHALFGVDSSNQTQLRGLPLPAQLELIIDDASHALAHQLAALEALWPRLAPGGIYIVEDLTIGALPWMRGAAGADQLRRTPTNNTNCGHECHYVQRPAEHPFIKRLVPSMADQKAANEALRLGPRLPGVVESILDRNAWHYTITGAHRGGGLDSTIIIEKTEREGKTIPGGSGTIPIDSLLSMEEPEWLGAAPGQPMLVDQASASTLVARHALPVRGELLSHAGATAIRSISNRHYDFLPSSVMLIMAACFLFYTLKGRLGAFCCDRTS